MLKVLKQLEGGKFKRSWNAVPAMTSKVRRATHLATEGEDGEQERSGVHAQAGT